MSANIGELLRNEQCEQYFCGGIVGTLIMRSALLPLSTVSPAHSALPGRADSTVDSGESVAVVGAFLAWHRGPSAATASELNLVGVSQSLGRYADEYSHWQGHELVLVITASGPPACDRWPGVRDSAGNRRGVPDHCRCAAGPGDRSTRTAPPHSSPSP